MKQSTNELPRLTMEPYVPYILRLWYDSPKQNDTRTRSYYWTIADVWKASKTGEEGIAEVAERWKSALAPTPSILTVANSFYRLWQAANLHKDTVIMVVRKVKSDGEGNYPYWDVRVLNGPTAGQFFTTLDFTGAAPELPPRDLGPVQLPDNPEEIEVDSRVVLLLNKSAASANLMMQGWQQQGYLPFFDKDIQWELTKLLFQYSARRSS